MEVRPFASGRKLRLGHLPVLVLSLKECVYVSVCVHVRACLVFFVHVPVVVFKHACVRALELCMHTRPIDSNPT